MSIELNNAGEVELGRLRNQRDQALVCAILALALSVGVWWTNFGREFPGLRETREAVQQHRALLVEHEGLLATVSAALLANRKEAENLRQVRQNSP
jgi:hypothetical protein